MLKNRTPDPIRTPITSRPQQCERSRLTRPRIRNQTPTGIPATRRGRREDKSTLRSGNAPEVMSALTNLVITLFRLQGVTKITAETRRNAQNPAGHSSYLPSGQAKHAPGL